MRFARGSLVVAAIVMVGALGMQSLRTRDAQLGDVTSPSRPIGLKDKVPRTLSTAIGTDEPLGATEFVASAVEKTLNFDDAVNRVFRTPRGTIGVYVAYWAPGRMPVEKVASHTPDRCWSENGWTCEQMRFPEVLAMKEGALKSGYWRLFAPPGGGPKQHVVYWHLVGGELHDYGNRINQRPRLVQWWRDAIRYAVAGSREQYFVRLSSDQPFEKLKGDPGFEEVLQSLAKLGLGEKS